MHAVLLIPLADALPAALYALLCFGKLLSTLYQGLICGEVLPHCRGEYAMLPPLGGPQRSPRERGGGGGAGGRAGKDERGARGKDGGAEPRRGKEQCKATQGAEIRRGKASGGKGGGGGGGGDAGPDGDEGYLVWPAPAPPAPYSRRAPRGQSCRRRRR